VVATGFADTGTRRRHDTLLAALDEIGPTSRADLGRRTTSHRSDMVAAGSADA
jgi:hypothetical protein